MSLIYRCNEKIIVQLLHHMNIVNKQNHTGSPIILSPISRLIPFKSLKTLTRADVTKTKFNSLLHANKGGTRFQQLWDWCSGPECCICRAQVPNCILSNVFPQRGHRVYCFHLNANSPLAHTAWGCWIYVCDINSLSTGVWTSVTNVLTWEVTRHNQEWLWLWHHRVMISLGNLAIYPEPMIKNDTLIKMLRFFVMFLCTFIQIYA